MGQLVVPASGVKPGTVAYFAAINPPPGWLACDGAEVSRQTYAALFQAIGTTFGAGNAAQNFLDDQVDAEALGGWAGPHGDLAAVDAGIQAPNGDLDAWKIVASSNDVNARFATTFSVPQQANYTFSVFVKNIANASRVAMNAASGTQLGSRRIVFDLNTGLFVFSTFATVGTPFAEFDGDWMRCVWTENITGFSQPFRIAPTVGDFGGPAAGAELGVWGLLIEEGAVASQYYGDQTFNLPDLRGEFIRGYDLGRGVDPDWIIREFSLGAVQMDDFKEHDHEFPVHFNTTDSLPICGGTGPAWSTGATGARGGFETRPRNVALLPCIKY